MIFAFATGRERGSGVLIPGAAGFLLGIFFFCFTMGIIPWSSMGWLWPILPLIGGISLIAAALVGQHISELLLPGLSVSGFAVVALFFTTAGWNLLWLGQYWPVVLIVLWAGLLVQNVTRRRVADH